MKTNVAIIGFMGVGKSTVGKLLAKKLGKQYVETDSLIVKRVGKSIPQIFKEDGEIAFRELEIEIIKELALKEGQVIDCGGGVVLNKINIDRLKQSSIVVWLTASPLAIARRTSFDGDGRPLLNYRNDITNIRSLLHERKPFYELASEIEVNTTGKSVELVVNKIIERLKQHEDFY